MRNNFIKPSLIGGPGSSVGIATDYGLDGPGSNYRSATIYATSQSLWAEAADGDVQYQT